ncbi:MAG: hypothetical protein L0Y72_14330 [Gemmataceae bacterium]|nr:hypothetical protein [Gemmataceae bacterium]MCI0740220.1 hypothetical protein [Gemmataceae bacterium]
MEPAGQSRKYWALAVTTSLLLHAGLLVGLSFLPFHGTWQADAAPARVYGISLVDDDGPGGEVHFIPNSENSESLAQPVHPVSQTPKNADAAQMTVASQHASDPRPAAPIDNSPPGGRGSNSEVGVSAAAGHADGTAKFFGIPARGSRIVYVLDCSGSMGKNGAIVVAARELVRSVEQLPAQAQFQVIVYNARPRLLLARHRGWLTASPQIIHEIETAFNSLPPEGNTDHGPALAMALAQQPDVVYFLTDADDLKQEQLRQTNLANRGRAVIHTVELTLANQHRIGMPMQLLARDNRGAYQAIDLQDYR